MKSFRTFCESDGPAYEHDCDQCKFVGQDKPRGNTETRANTIDMYVHHDPKGNHTLIRRWSSTPSEYSAWKKSYVDKGDDKWHAVLDAYKKHIDEGWKHDSYRDRLLHSKQIGPHKVDMEFEHYGHKEWGVNYEVNGKIYGHGESKRHISPEHKHAILHHVGKTVDRFIRHVKPRHLALGTFEEKKKTMYRKFTDHIAKKHNATVDHVDDGLGEFGKSTLHFPHHDK